MKTIDTFQRERTKIMSEMLDNPNKHGIYPTSIAFEKLDKLFRQLVRSECVDFGADFMYHTANPDTKMDVPTVAYIASEKYYDKLNQL